MILTLVKIKRFLIAGRIRFTEKSVLEMERDRLTRVMVIEAILNAPAIVKTITSRNPISGNREHLYVISGQTYSGIIINTKGKFLRVRGEELFYILISSKRDTN